MMRYCLRCKRTSTDWLALGKGAMPDGRAADVYKHRPCGGWLIVPTKEPAAV